MRLLFLTFFLSLFLISCETEPPNILDTNQKEGSVVISSDISGADVFVNNEYKGVTDLTLTLPSGNYTIYLVKDTLRSDTQTVNVESGKTYNLYFVLGQKSAVLLEDFANVSCDPCVVSSEILRKLTASHYSDNKLIVIRYATNFPSPNDPFYLANSNMNDARIGLYNVLFAPTTVVDGMEKPIATDSLSIIDAVDSRLAVHSSFAVENLVSEVSNDSISISGDLVVPSSELENVNMFIALLQKEIVYQTPPGSNGETVFRDVAFDFLPSINGTPIVNFTTNGNKARFDFRIANNYSVASANMEIVLFVQNIISKEVYFVTKK